LVQETLTRAASRADRSASSAARRAVALAYGALCHALFASAVAAMVLAMLFGMSRSLGPFAAPWSVAANALLVLQFPLAHSFLLTQAGRAVLRRLAPREFANDLSPTSFVIIASLQVMLLFAFWSPSGIVWWRATGASRAILLILYAGAWLLLAKSIIDAGASSQTGYLGWRAVLRGARPAYPPMPRTGLFRLCRQPIYLAFALTLWTVPVWTPDQLALALALTAYCVLGPLLKERRFRLLFGAEFEEFARRTPYFLPWPRLRRPRP
jgi:protein-S-isoprenylcysteine O-methyltransferase Ste14